jgi:energy-coupling factor transport system ATP-binding protein
MVAHIEIKSLSFTYPDTEAPALSDINLRIQKGQFIVLFGASGSGKSTLLRLLKKEIQPYGTVTGEIRVDGVNVDQEGTPATGYVFQDPENQVVADEVLHELVFGLENIGMKTNEMRNKVAEMVHFFGIESLLHRKTHELSGGQKQQVNLASVLLMQPNILLLDEPTAQLDPVSAKEFLNILVQLNEEFGITIVLAEHRLDEVISIADKVVMMDKGKIVQQGHAKSVLSQLWNTSNRPFIPSIPAFALSVAEQEEVGELPLTVKDGRSWLDHFTFTFQTKNQLVQPLGEEMLKAKNLHYQYSKESMVLKELNLSLRKGEVYALLGGNGTGKSTFLKILAGVLKPLHGKVYLNQKVQSYKGDFDWVRKVGYLPQNLKPFFIQDSVELELKATMAQFGSTDPERLEQLLETFDISKLLCRHPYDLSGGELQKAALACLLLRQPELLILDEPTKGLDAVSKEHLAALLTELRKQNITILFSTHDVEFAARYATRCGMLFQGQITAEDEPTKFFAGNFFYTTMIQRLFRNEKDNLILTLEEAVTGCVQNEGSY